ncbi:unnamed protein product, partial [Ectocarpus sp. 13 AM-2016]
FSSPAVLDSTLPSPPPPRPPPPPAGEAPTPAGVETIELVPRARGSSTLATARAAATAAAAAAAAASLRIGAPHKRHVSSPAEEWGPAEQERRAGAAACPVTPSTPPRK